MGTVYIGGGCTLQALEHYPRKGNVIRICPVTRRNLHHSGLDDDEHNFYFSFDSKKDLDTWKAAIDMELSRGGREKADATIEQWSSATRGGARKESSRVSIGDDINVLPLAPVEPRPESPASSERASSYLLASDALFKSNTDSSFGLTRRKGFFSVDEIVKCHNSDVVHPLHCARCRVDPIAGFAYTCVACEGFTLCGQCFHDEDHDPRHLFLVAPDIEGESLRITASMEGALSPFLTVELLAFEALFRLIGGHFDGEVTAAISKRRLLTFWRRSGVPEKLFISEKDLAALCRDPSVVSFPEFMFLVRNKLGSPSSFLGMCGDQFPRGFADRCRKEPHAVQKEHIDYAFARLSAMIRGAAASGPEEASAASCREFNHTLKDIVGASKGHTPFSHLDRAALHLLLGSCSNVCRVSPDLEVVPLRLHHLLVQRTLQRFRLPGEQCTDSAVETIVSKYALQFSSSAESHAPDTSRNYDEPVVLVSQVISSLETLWSRLSEEVDVPQLELLKPLDDHTLSEVVNHVLLYDLREGFGYYTSQPETIHPNSCDECFATPIVGYRFHCTVCDNYDLCLRCSKCRSHSHPLIRLPGGSTTSLTTPPSVSN
jgi:hypothetical protein